HQQLGGLRLRGRRALGRDAEPQHAHLGHRRVDGADRRSRRPVHASRRRSALARRVDPRRRSRVCRAGRRARAAPPDAGAAARLKRAARRRRHRGRSRCRPAAHPLISRSPSEETAMTVTRRDTLTASAAALLSGWGRAFAQAAPPFDTVKVVTGFPPGGTSDTICRRVASKLAPGYGKSVVVENRVGAGGQIAVQSFKSAPADGTSILQTPMSMLGIYPHIYKKLQYDPATDVTPVSLGATFDFGFAAGPAVPASVRNIPEFLDWCKAN